METRRQRRVLFLAGVLACACRADARGIEGTVLWPDGETPVVDAIVGLDYHESVTRTDEHGAFRIDGVEPGEHDLVVRVPMPLSPDELAAQEAFARTSGKSMPASVRQGFEEIVVRSKVAVVPNVTARLALLVPDGLVLGVVRTEAGGPAGGVWVVVNGRPRMTDAAGRFEVAHLPAGPCGLYVEGRNHEIRRTTINVASSGKATPVEITLYSFRPEVVYHFSTPGGSVVANELMRRANRQYAGGRIASWGFDGLKTDADGLWREQWIDSGTRHYLFFSTTYGSAEQVVGVDEGVRESLYEVTLTSGGSICGTVRDQLTGAPLGGVVLTPIRVGADGTYDQESLWNMLFSGIHNRFVSGYPITQVSRDGDGTFCIRNLPAGMYRLLSHGTGLGEQFELADGEDLSDVEIVVATPLAQRWIVGRVLGPDDAPVVNTEVTIITDNEGPGADFYSPLFGVPRRAVTDDLGRFRLGPLEPREYWIGAWTPGHRSPSTPADVTAESIDVGDLRLIPAEGW